MRARRFSAGFAALALAATAACGGGNKNSNTNSAAAPASRPATAAAGASVRPAVGSTGAPASPAAVRPVTTPTGACLSFPLQPLDTAAAASSPKRPDIDLSKSAFTVVPADMPPGFGPSDAGEYSKGEKRVVGDIAAGSANPQASISHLNEIGYVDGRQQGWAAPETSGVIPTVSVQHFVFQTDAGASNFLHNPVIVAGVCVKADQAPQIGQETNALYYTATAARANTQFEGRGILWRCGRVVLNVTGAGLPGQFTPATMAGLAQKIQAEFLKTGQPCS